MKANYKIVKEWTGRCNDPGHDKVYGVYQIEFEDNSTMAFSAWGRREGPYKHGLVDVFHAQVSAKRGKYRQEILPSKITDPAIDMKVSLTNYLKSTYGASPWQNTSKYAIYRCLTSNYVSMGFDYGIEYAHGHPNIQSGKLLLINNLGEALLVDTKHFHLVG